MSTFNNQSFHGNRRRNHAPPKPQSTKLERVHKCQLLTYDKLQLIRAATLQSGSRHCVRLCQRNLRENPSNNVLFVKWKQESPHTVNLPTINSTSQVKCLWAMFILDLAHPFSLQIDYFENCIIYYLKAFTGSTITNPPPFTQKLWQKLLLN